MNAEDTLTRIRRLDLVTLAQIHDRYYPDIYRYIRYRLDDETVSEDLTSEVFLRLLDALHKQGGPTKDLRNWLFGTASNLVNDYFRTHYKRKIHSLEEQEDAEATSDSPEMDLDNRLQHQQLRKAIQKLTPEQQHVLALRFAENYSLEQTANQMKRSINAIKALQFRAIEALKRLMDEPMSEF